MNMVRFLPSRARPFHLVALGLLIREMFSFWTGHPYDLEVWIRSGYYVAQGANPYAHFLPPVPGLSIAFLDQSLPGVGYLPLWPAILAGLYKAYALIPGASPLIFYFLVKQPMILADTYLGVLIYRAVLQWDGSVEAATRALKSWILFPYPILISAVWGQFDAFVAILLLTALLTDRVGRRYLETGLAVFLKWYPIVLLPYYLLREPRLRKCVVPIALLVPAIGTLTIFVATGWDFVGVTAMTISASHGGGLGMTYMSVLQDPFVMSNLGRFPFVYVALGYLWVPGVAVAGYAAHRFFRGGSPYSLVQSLLLVAVVFYLTRYGVYEQYLLYLLPFFLVDIVLWHPERKRLFRFVWVLVLAYLLVNNDFLVRFLGPVDTHFVDIAFQADNAPVLGILRLYTLYALGILITITFLQLLLVFVNPSKDPRPWPVLWIERIRVRLPWFRPQPAQDTKDSSP